VNEPDRAAAYVARVVEIHLRHGFAKPSAADYAKAVAATRRLAGKRAQRKDSLAA
jgi:hypothetical protein